LRGTRCRSRPTLLDQGIHFRTADVQGAKIGKDVARWLDKHYFQAATPYVDAAK
jgi:hypothetical protein